MTKKKIAVLFPAFFNGGAEFITAWMLESLKYKYRVSLFTFSEIDFSRINHQFGTTLSSGDIEVRIIHLQTKFFTNPQKYSLMTIRQHLLAYYYRKIYQEFDLSIAAFNEMDLGRPGIQYIHVPLFGHGNEIARRIFHYPTSPIRTLYQRVCEQLTGYSDERMKQNTTLTNSHWTADLIKKSYGIDAKILYPMVILAPINTLWEERENGFILSGRLTPDKNIETAVEIIRRVREVQNDVHLHIVCSGYELNYRNKLLKLRDQHSTWLFIQENLNRTEYTQLLSLHRYGIHARANETFGITIAEMVSAGCIPFIPSRGGQVEITGNNPALQYETVDEAVNKIRQIISSPTRQEALLQSLTSRKNMFTLENFRETLMFYIDHEINIYGNA